MATTRQRITPNICDAFDSRTPNRARRRNPALAAERARKRGELLAATELDLAKIAAATQRSSRALRGEQAIALRVGRLINRFHMAKHFELTITDTALMR